MVKQTDDQIINLQKLVEITKELDQEIEESSKSCQENFGCSGIQPLQTFAVFTETQDS
jgi:hypothetical protein